MIPNSRLVKSTCHSRSLKYLPCQIYEHVSLDINCLLKAPFDLQGNTLILNQHSPPQPSTLLVRVCWWGGRSKGGCKKGEEEANMDNDRLVLLTSPLSLHV